MFWGFARLIHYISTKFYSNFFRWLNPPHLTTTLHILHVYKYKYISLQRKIVQNAVTASGSRLIDCIIMLEKPDSRLSENAINIIFDDHSFPFIFHNNWITGKHTINWIRKCCNCIKNNFPILHITESHYKSVMQIWLSCNPITKLH